MARPAEDQEIILKVGGDEISLTLYGVRLGNDKWKFLLEKDEGTMADFLPEQDAGQLPVLHTRSEYVDTWDKALALLDRYLWAWLPIQQVHFEFTDLVFSAFKSRSLSKLWKSRLDEHCQKESRLLPPTLNCDIRESNISNAGGVLYFPYLWINNLRHSVAFGYNKLKEGERKCKKKEDYLISANSKKCSNHITKSKILI
jgi:hypothetical protein